MTSPDGSTNLDEREDSDCPGCGRPLDEDGDCERCEYANLASGRYHYCGSDSCHCRDLRRTIRRSVLDEFAKRFVENCGGRSYREVVRTRLLGD